MSDASLSTGGRRRRLAVAGALMLALVSALAGSLGGSDRARAGASVTQ